MEINDISMRIASDEDFAQHHPASRPRRVVWLDSLPLPMRTDEFIFSFHDKRTTPRLRLFNRIAETLLNVYIGAHTESRRVSLLSFFDMAQSVMDAGSPDDAHLIGYAPALDAMADALITTLCEDFDPRQP